MKPCQTIKLADAATAIAMASVSQREILAVGTESGSISLHDATSGAELQKFRQRYAKHTLT